MDGTVRDRILKIFGQDNFTNRISSRGCRGSLKGISKSNRLIVDVDRYTRKLVCASKRCDYVLFSQNKPIEKLICVLVELKSGEYRVDDVVEKLQCTAQYLDKSLDLESRLGVKLILCPLLLRKRGPHSKERKKFEKAAISYRGTMKSIYRSQCGIEGNVIDAMPEIFSARI